MTNAGSNLSYGIRSLYQRQFSRFDEWLSNGGNLIISKDDVPIKSAEVEEVGKDMDPEAEEAAAILESLMGTGELDDAVKTTPRKRKAAEPKADPNVKVRACCCPQFHRASCLTVSCQLKRRLAEQEAGPGQEEHRRGKRQSHTSQHRHALVRDLRRRAPRGQDHPLRQACPFPRFVPAHSQHPHASGPLPESV